MYKAFSRKTHRNLHTLIFKDIRKTAPDRVDVLLKTQHGQITQVDPVSNSLLVSDECKLSLQHPVFVEGVQLSVIHLANNQIWVTDVTGVQVGQAVRQTQFTGAAEDMFQAFGEEWSKRWDRHRDVPLSQWDQICSFGRQFFQNSEIQLPEWNVDMLRQEIARKKPKSATGLDGVSLADLKALPVRALQAHCDIYRAAECRGAWPRNKLWWERWHRWRKRHPQLMSIVTDLSQSCHIVIGYGVVYAPKHCSQLSENGALLFCLVTSHTVNRHLSGLILHG